MLQNKPERAMVASHIPLLVRVFDLSEGDVLEIGTGYFSTLVLHWLATMSKRHVYSYESKTHWFHRAQKHESEYHHIIFCDDWAGADFDQRDWGMAFVDHSPGWRRPIDVARLANIATYIVIHDTEPDWDNQYEFSKVWGLFKYRYDYRRMVPMSSVVSNFKELGNIA